MLIPNLVSFRILGGGHPQAPGGIDLVHGILDLDGGLDVGDEGVKDQEAVACGRARNKFGIGSMEISFPVNFLNPTRRPCPPGTAISPALSTGRPNPFTRM